MVHSFVQSLGPKLLTFTAQGQSNFQFYVPFEFIEYNSALEFLHYRGEWGNTGFSVDPIGVGVDIPLLVCRISLEPGCRISPNLH